MIPMNDLGPGRFESTVYTPTAAAARDAGWTQAAVLFRCLLHTGPERQEEHFGRHTRTCGRRWSRGEGSTRTCTHTHGVGLLAPDPSAAELAQSFFPSKCERCRVRRSLHLGCSSPPRREQSVGEINLVHHVGLAGLPDWWMREILFSLLKLSACEQTLCHTHPQTACPCKSC